MASRLSVVIPVYNGAAVLEDCLAHLSQARSMLLECVVVDDGSSDESAEVARVHGAVVVRTDGRRGPAHARNIGARAARGDVIFFLDADVRVHPDTVSRVQQAFAADPDLDALIGSYDDEPASSSFLSQYKNLLHCYTHRNANQQASTFWTACGAIRRELLLAFGGFDESYRRPSIEDIELGYRLAAAGRKLRLDRRIQVKHLKHWSFGGLLRSDIRDRAIPWTELTLRSRRMPKDLNLRSSQRFSVLLSISMLPLGILVSPLPAALAFAGVVVLNLSFYRFLAARRGALFALRAIPLHILYFFYSGVSFAAGVARHLAPGLLARRGFQKTGSARE